MDTSFSSSAIDSPKMSPIENLLHKIPQIGQHFSVVKKIGEGTFSNVFIASSKELNGRKFAIKHLTPTSLPSRIIQEIKCLLNVGGRDNVVGLEVCFRNQDAVAFVMPYFAHDSFSKFIFDLTLEEIQLYMKNLLIALRHVHSSNIIHRDVKPSNFLYNRQYKRFLLVDFGLSQNVEHRMYPNTRKRPLEPPEQEPVTPNDKKRPVLHSLTNNVPGPSTTDRSAASAQKRSNKKKSPLYKENSPISRKSPGKRNINHVKRNLQFETIVPAPEVKNDVVTPVLGEKSNLVAAANKSPFWNISRQLENDKISNLCETSNAVSVVTNPTSISFKTAGTSFFQVQNSRIKSQIVVGGLLNKSDQRQSLILNPCIRDECGCEKRPKICNRCIVRKSMQAPRAGTPGYRPPEVLLKYPHQTTAVDVWSAGVIMLSLVSRSYPFFRAPDDVSALMEFASVFGTRELTNIARKLGRNLLTSENCKSINLSELCEKLRNRRLAKESKKDTENTDLNGCIVKIDEDGCPSHDSIHPKLVISKENVGRQSLPDEAYDLLSKLLTLDPGKRISANAALSHPFFTLDLSPDS